MNSSRCDEALDYTARLRLPPDTTAEQRRAAVDGAARSVDLFDRLDQRIGALSGGQKKCASLASEILSRPSVLFLDEVTSGLDESTDWDIMRLLRRLADERDDHRRGHPHLGERRGVL